MSLIVSQDLYPGFSFSTGITKKSYEIAFWEGSFDQRIFISQKKRNLQSIQIPFSFNILGNLYRKQIFLNFKTGYHLGILKKHGAINDSLLSWNNSWPNTFNIPELKRNRIFHLAEIGVGIRYLSPNKTNFYLGTSYYFGFNEIIEYMVPTQGSALFSSTGEHLRLNLQIAMPIFKHKPSIKSLDTSNNRIFTGY